MVIKKNISRHINPLRFIRYENTTDVRICILFLYILPKKFDADNDRLNGSKALTSEVMNPHISLVIPLI